MSKLDGRPLGDRHSCGTGADKNDRKRAQISNTVDALPEAVDQPALEFQVGFLALLDPNCGQPVDPGTTSTSAPLTTGEMKIVSSSRDAVCITVS